jgi:GABA(A) receptor-associated protein
MIPYRNRLAYEERCDECKRAKARRPDHYPVILERARPNDPLLDKDKFLLPGDITGAQLLFVVRRRMSIAPESALFLFAGGRLLPACELVARVHERYKEDDGFLYVKYGLENTFG